MIRNEQKLVVVFGGSGFLGRHVTRSLAKNGYRVRVACRRPDLAGHLRVLGNVGQVQLAQANVRNKQSIERVMEGADAVVNLVGLLVETRRQKFEEVHAKAAGRIAKLANEQGARMIHVSAIGTEAKSESEYARTKAKGESAVKKYGGIIIRPSVIFGPEDKFLNMFAFMAMLSPIMPVIGANTKLQPVYVGDVAEAITRVVNGEASGESVWEIAGPDVMTIKECIQTVLKIVGRKRILVAVPFGIANAISKVTQYVPTKPLTPDQVELLKHDNVIKKQKNNLFVELGIKPQSVAGIIPQYMTRFKKHGQFEEQVSSIS